MTQKTNHKYSHFLKWIIIIIALISVINKNTLAQEETIDSVQVTELEDTLDYEFNFYMFDFSYTSNKLRSKNQTEENIPAYFGNFTFLHKTGLYTDLMYTNYAGADSTSYDLDLTFGFQKSILKEVFDVDLSYRYHKYSGTSEFESIEYNHALNVSAGATYKILYLYADGDFYLDNKNYFTDFGLSILINFDDVLYKNDFILFQPTISLTYGTDYWLYDTYEPYVENVLKPLLNYRGYPVNLLSNEELISRYMTNQGVSTNTYTHQNIDFMIPITYGINSVSVSLAWMYSIPSEKLEIFGVNNQSGYLISLSLMF